MKKYLSILFRLLLILLMLMPILGAFGTMPAPTRDLYNTDQAFAFINMLMAVKYILYINAIVFTAAVILTIMNRMALVALLILPITVNIVAFHLFLDGGLFKIGALMGNILLLLNVYFLWQGRKQYTALLQKGA